MPDTLIDAPAVWTPPEHVRVRGTLALVAGAGESARVYERFGRRLASDGYVVGVFETADADPAAVWLDSQPGSPRVLVGSDAGAAAVLHLAVARPAVADGLVVAGLPVGPSDADHEPAARTACPVHLAVLGEDTSRARSAAPALAVPDAATLRTISAPVLAVHGGADSVSPIAAARLAYAALPAAELVETVDGLHDALNDQSHRSVAAAVVLWLERLRAAGVDEPIVRIGKP